MGIPSPRRGRWVPGGAVRCDLPQPLDLENKNTHGKIPLTKHFRVDAFEPELERFPLIRRARRYRTVQEPGQLVYIPAGAPHAVRNLEDIVGIAMSGTEHLVLNPGLVVFAECIGKLCSVGHS